MRIIALDFETYFDGDYSLKKLTTEAYVRDPRFEAHGASIKWGADYPARWYAHRELKHVLAQEDWSSIAIIAHHAQFDGLVLNHHYGVRPHLWFDTLSMARLLLGNHLSTSLDSVRKHFGFPVKRTPYELFKGWHWRELDKSTQELIADGCCDEVESIWQLFGKLAQAFPPGEYSLVDTTIRMFTEPALRGDIGLLGEIWHEENNRKRDICADLGIKPSDLQSASKFADLLRAQGIEPALKTGKNGPIFAFAKTDDFMKELLENEDERISGLARARLGIKSSGMQTRVETIGGMASRGPLCTYLRYAGAHTGRWSGGDGSNFQNFKRGSLLRKAIVAPPGYALAAIDSSQIECRVLNYLAGQQDVIERFWRGEDPYVDVPSKLYGRVITKADPGERGLGKQAELSCGYGCGGPKFKRTAALGIYGPPVILSEEQSSEFVVLYRQTHPRVVGYWNEAERMLGELVNGKTVQWGPLLIKNHRIYLPTGLMLNYETLEWHVDPETGEKGFRLKTRQGWQRVWGSKLVQHVCEAVARAIVGEAMKRITAQGLRIVGMAHDEIWVLIPRRPGIKAEYNFCLQAMRHTPEWLPGLPLDAEGVIGERYGK